VTVALLFSPQGSQSVGMGHALAAVSPAAAAVFREADDALGWSVSGVAWNGPEGDLNNTRQTQPCLVATSIACLRALQEELDGRGERLSAAFVAGHSVGEYAALVAAGALSVADAVRLVARRGELMADSRVGGGMVAVIGLDREVVASVLARLELGVDLVLANDNAPGQIVISGTRGALATAAGPLRSAGARRSIPLNVSGPFHSPHMTGIGSELARALVTADWHAAEPPVVSNVTAEPVRDAGEIRDLLARQVHSPVEWVRSVRRMVAEGVDTFVECGPGNALTGMVRRIVPQARTLNVFDPASLAASADALAGAAARVPA
jgi:[acyl-carrier-protein] S-malonyltransferase